MTHELLERGTDYTKKDDDGKTLLHYAAGNTNITKLRHYDIDFEARDNYGRTPIYYIDTPRIIREMLSYNINLDIVDNDGKSPTQYNTSLAEYIRKIGVPKSEKGLYVMPDVLHTHNHNTHMFFKTISKLLNHNLLY